LISQHLATKLNTSVVVLNKPGASGVIGKGAVVQAAPDGYTVLYDATPLSINLICRSCHSIHRRTWCR
jgi:tripartite-type tricarboxylate transporter receptor subunit TctC